MGEPITEFIDQNVTIEQAPVAAPELPKPRPKEMEIPDYYTENGTNWIDAVKMVTTREGFEGFCMGSIMKYLIRHKDMEGKADLLKAQKFLKILTDFHND